MDTSVAYCDLGCYDAAVDLIERVVDRILARDPDQGPTGRRQAVDNRALRSYATLAAHSALGELHRCRRKRLGLPQRPERVTDARWAGQILPAIADRELLSHILTWLGSDALAAADGAGWPLDAWSARYGVSVATMRAWVDRLVTTIRVRQPKRYVRYIAGPLAAKARSQAVFTDIEEAFGEPVARRGRRLVPAEPLWPADSSSQEMSSDEEESTCVA